jgi:hypothetical protein
MSKMYSEKLILTELLLAYPELTYTGKHRIVRIDHSTNLTNV